jgi:hypothetical protein
VVDKIMRRFSLSVGLAALAALALGQLAGPVSASPGPRAPMLLASHESAPAPMTQASAPMTVPEREALVEQYCGYCHDDDLREGGFSFSEIDLAHPEENAEQAEKVFVKLRTGMMPPAGMPRPDDDSLTRFATALETDIDRIAAENPNPGRPSLHRLNRTEYSNSIRDLLDLEINAAILLPADDMSHGFDNMSEVLNVSSTLMEAYIRAAGKIGRVAVGDPGMQPVVETYAVSTSFSQDNYVEGTPFGTRGGVAFNHNFPADGEYVFIVSLVFTANTNLFGNSSKGEKVEVAINGEQVALFDVDPMMQVDELLETPPIKIPMGPQSISVSFMRSANRSDGPYDDLLRPLGRTLGDISAGSVMGLTNLPHVRDVGIKGPYNASGVSDTPTRRKIFTCRPSNAGDEAACATEIISALARQAFRKPVEPEHLEELMAVYQTGRDDGDFDSGIRLALQLMLAHPEFVFRFEKTLAGAAPGTNYKITDLELAARLSYFLWSTAPDDALITVASQGGLSDPAILETQVRRMLADPRSESLARNFAGQWLYLRNLSDSQPDIYLFPEVDEGLLRSMGRETELLFDSIVRENRNVLDLLTADYTFVNETLAKHYGIPDVVGNRFRRVDVTDENRYGVLGHGSVLTVTSFSNRTSPVVRGKWILEQLVGMKPPVPPPNVPVLAENAVNGGELIKPKSVRDRLALHRENEPCNSCHKIMDPIGLSLENFDAVGAWRERDSGSTVVTTGELVDGTPVNSPVSLRNAILGYSESYLRNFTKQLLTYALGRGVEYYDMPVVRQIVREAGDDDNRFVPIVLGIVNSLPFQMRRTEAASEMEEGRQ